MQVEIRHFRGHGAKEAKSAVFRHFKNTARKNWHFYSDLDQATGTARFGGWYLSAAWTGQSNPYPQFPLWVWRKVAGLQNRSLSDWLLARMKRISGLA